MRSNSSVRKWASGSRCWIGICDWRIKLEMAVLSVAGVQRESVVLGWFRTENADRMRKRGFVLLRGEKWEEAVAVFSKALALQSDLRAARIGRAWAHFKLGKLREGLEDATAALNDPVPVSPNMRAAMFATRACCMHALDSRTEALADFDAAIALLPRADWFL